MQVTRIQIKNFLSISDAEIKPNQVTQVVGKNGQGKTSVLKALEWAIKGGADATLVKNGEEGGEVVVELSDATTIRRRISKGGNQGVTVTREGMKAAQPQAMLDQLFESSAFNPLELMDPKKRTDAILKSIDLAVSETMLANRLGLQKAEMPAAISYDQHGIKVVDQVHKYFYQRRAEANKDAEAKKRRHETYKRDLPEATVKVEGTRDEINAHINELTGERAAVMAKLNSANDQIAMKERAQKRVLESEDRQRDLKIKKLGLEKELEAVLKAIANEANAEKNAQEDYERIELPDVQALNDQSAQIGERINQQVLKLRDLDTADAQAKQHAMVAAMYQEYEAAQAIANALDKRVDMLGGSIKKEIMASAEMPVKGLEYRDGTFYIDDIAVDNLSSSQTIRLAIGVARKLAKKTKLILLDGAEALDEDTYNTLRKEIDGDGFLYVLTKVGDPFPASNDTVVRMHGGEVMQ